MSNDNSATAQGQGAPMELTDELRLSNPRMFNEGVHSAVMQRLSALFAQQMSQFHANVMNTVASIHKELSLFRELEVHMGKNSLTEEILADIMQRLFQHREMVQGKAAAEQQAATAEQAKQQLQ